jgi:hypothetical protein
VSESMDEFGSLITAAKAYYRYVAAPEGHKESQMDFEIKFAEHIFTKLSESEIEVIKAEAEAWYCLEGFDSQEVGS